MEIRIKFLLPQPFIWTEGAGPPSAMEPAMFLSCFYSSLNRQTALQDAFFNAE